jgi:hypothetical protein
VHKPIVLSAICAPGSICHHWQSLHIPQSDAAIVDSSSASHASKRHQQKGQARALPCAWPPGPTGLPAPSGLCHHHHRHAISIPPLSPYRRRWVWDGSQADDGAGGGSQGRAGAAIPQLKMKGSPAMTINLRRETHQVTMEKRVTTSDDEPGNFGEVCTGGMPPCVPQRRGREIPPE